MTKHLYWLSDAEWAKIEPLLPRGRRGARRVDDRRVISGIIHMLKTGARWRDLGVWQRLLEIVSDDRDLEWLMVDASHIKAHPHAAGPYVLAAPFASVDWMRT